MHKTSFFVVSVKVALMTLLMLRKFGSSLSGPKGRREDFNKGTASVLYYTLRTGTTN